MPRSPSASLCPQLLPKQPTSADYRSRPCLERSPLRLQPQQQREPQHTTVWQRHCSPGKQPELRRARPSHAPVPCFPPYHLNHTAEHRSCWPTPPAAGQRNRLCRSNGRRFYPIRAQVHAAPPRAGPQLGSKRKYSSLMEALDDARPHVRRRMVRATDPFLCSFRSVEG